MVHLKDVTMRYRNGGTLAANNLSLDINEGEFVFLVGPSGSGKTTIIKLLTGEVRADSEAPQDPRRHFPGFPADR